jgi:hypothetical protein
MLPDEFENTSLPRHHQSEESSARFAGVTIAISINVLSFQMIHGEN